jgi:hypothetical protein
MANRISKLLRREWARGPMAALLIIGIAGVSLESQAVPVYSISHGGSTAEIDADGGAGMKKWEVGGVNQLQEQWFYYRLGGGLAQPINALSPSSLLYNDANTLILKYANAQLSFTVSYLLTGGGLGAGSADILETVVVDNLSGGPLDLHFFQYSDFNLLGTPGGDKVEFLSASSVLQTEGLFGIQEGIIQPPSSHREAAFTGLGGSKANLLGVPGYNLNDADGPLVGDVTWSFQWDAMIAPGQSLEIYKDKTLIVPSIPEPSVMALTAICLGAGMLMRRRFRK